METHIITLTFQDCAVRYGLTEADVLEFLDLGLLHPAPHVPNAVAEEPDHVARLARLHHELGLSKESLDVIMAMRQRMEQMQQELQLQRARVRQLELYLRSSGPVLDIDFR